MPLPTYDKTKRKQTFQQLPKGAYVVVIKNAKEVPNKNGAGTHLEIAFDIAEGEYKGFYMAQFEQSTSEDKKYSRDAYYYLNVPDDNSKPYVWDNWNTMLERIREESPDVEIVLMSCIPLYGDDQEAQAKKFIEYNTLITQYNADLKQFAEDNGCMWLDLNYYVIDHNGRMPKIYNQGEYHMNQEGCNNWMKILRYYAQYELEGGSLS